MTEGTEPEMTVEAFWVWALAHYDGRECQQLLLRLQKEGDLVILEALYACWLAQVGRPWFAGDFAKMRGLTESWIDEVVLPLRATREKWKPDPDQRHQRESLLKLEVEAERHLAGLMWIATSECRASSEFGSGLHGHEALRGLMVENLSVLPPFCRGKYVSERAHLVALLCEST
jgi:uncharacterized protein (TIGR02444 family)